MSKMALKMLGLVLCLVASQELHAALINEGGASCNIQTQQLRSQISLAANTARLEISSAVQNNGNNIAAVRANIQLQIRALRERAYGSASPNKHVCINNLELALAQLNDQALNLCYQNADINLLNLQVNQINNLKGTVAQICSNCNRQFPLLGQAEEYDKCVSSQIGDVQAQLKDLQAQVSSGAADLQSKSTECAENAQNNANDVIHGASEDFDACIAGP